MRLLIATLVALLLTASAAAQAETLAADAQFARFLEWFPGEYDNNEQVWQNAIDQPANPHERIHHIFLPVDIPALGEHVYFVQQTLDDDPSKIYRIRAYSLSQDAERKAVALTIWTFKDEAAARDAHLAPERLRELGKDDFSSIPGCAVYWTWSGQHFDGAMVRDACRFESKRSGKMITINDDLRLSDDAIWIRDVAMDEDGGIVFGDPDRPHHKNRKVRYFDGWAAMKEGGSDAGPDAQWIGVRGLRLHSEGDRVDLVTSEGVKLGYSVELAQLTYQNTTTPILKLAVIDNATGKSTSYSWTETSGTRVGINIGWFQTGFVEREGDPRFGW